MKVRCAQASCRACATRGLSPILDLGLMPLADSFPAAEELATPESRYPLELALCGSCGLVQILETVPPSVLFAADYPYYSSCSSSWLAHCAENAWELIHRYRLNARSLVIEIASNDGYILENFRAAGVPCMGIDPAPGPAQSAVARGIETINDFFTEELAMQLQSQGRQADLVITNNVLAHVADPHDFIRGITRIMRPKGHWVIEVPYLRPLVESAAFDTIYHEHLCYFSVRALQTLVHLHDLHIRDVRRLETHGGSLRVYVGKEHCHSPALEHLLAEERDQGLHDVAYYRSFAERVTDLRRALTELLDTLAAEGRRIAAYGAAAKGTILLNAIGPAARHVQFAVDRNVHKQGKYIPGCRIPILSPDAITTLRPDFLLLTPWNLREEVMAQQSDFRQRGGRFIIPIPRPVVD
jgi:SAM-dependent methyltransferase